MAVDDDEVPGVLVEGGAQVASPEPEPVAESAPSSGVDELDALLKQWDDGIAKAEPAATEVAPEPGAEQTDLDKLIADLDQPADPGAAIRQDLLGQAMGNLGVEQPSEPTELERALWQASERKHFNEYAALHQQDVPEHLGKDYVRKMLLAQAVEDPMLREAWDARDVDPRARNYLRVATLRLVGEAKKSRPIDANATADREMIAQAVRNQSGRAPEEPAPDFGQMTDGEFRDYKRQFGF